MKPPKYFRKDLTSEFLRAAHKKPKSLLGKIVEITEDIRRDVLFPASQNLSGIEVERKDTGAMRGSDAKTLTIKTDGECEKMAKDRLRAAFPDAYILGEERFGAASTEVKLQMLEEALKADKVVFLVDALDGTRDFRSGEDGYGVMITALQNNQVLAAVAHRCTDYADPAGHGHLLTFERGDCVRLDGKALTPLSERKFPDDASKIRGYAGFEFIAAMKKEGGKFPNLAGKFDSLSDLWTCTKMYNDLVTGQHHFMLVPPPTDLFDYPAGIEMIQKAGGVARFMDGTDASFPEIVSRQYFNRENPKDVALKDVLVFAVSEDVFRAVQTLVMPEIVQRPGPGSMARTPSP